MGLLIDPVKSLQSVARAAPRVDIASVSLLFLCALFITHYYPEPRRDGAASIFAVCTVCKAAMALALPMVGGDTPDELDRSKASELEVLHPRPGH